MSIIRLLALLLCFSSVVNAQKIRHYTMDNGLPSNHVYKIAQDYRGFIWILTDHGMARYDGEEFKIFTTQDGLPMNDIWDFRFTPDGKVWFLTRAAKLGYILDNEVVAFGRQDTTEILYPSIILQAGNEIAFVTGNEYYEVSGSLTGKENLRWVQNPVKAKKWIQSSKRLLKALSKETGAYYLGRINDSLSICLGQNSYIILNQNSGQVIKHRYDEFDPGLSQTKYARFFVQNGTIQICGMGFNAILNSAGNLTNITKLPNNYHAHNSTVDRDGNLWMATLSNGVYFMDAAARQSNYPMMGHKVSRLKKINQTIIASVFNKGFYEYLPQNGSFQLLIKDTASIYTAIPIGSTTYYLTDLNYFKQQGKQQKKYPRDLEKLAIFDLLMFQDTLFGISSTGIIALDSANFEYGKSTASIGLSDFFIYQNRLFLASANGLQEYSNGRITKVKIGHNTFDKPILHLDTSDAKLIICTDGFGGYVTDLERVELLPQSGFLSIPSAFSQDGQLWLATNSGILQYHLGQDRTTFVKKYTQADGLLSKSTLDVLAFGDSLVVASNTGLCLIPKHRRQSAPRISNIYFKSISYGAHLVPNDTAIEYQADSQLDVKIGFIDFTNRNRHFEYRLLPTIKNWQQTNTANLNFNNLRPNHYKLEIKKGTQTTFLSFDIQPLWYQTSIFRGLFIGWVLLSIIYIFIKYNRKQLKKQKQRLSVRQKEIEQELYALRSQMNPHFVFNSLNAIQYYIANNDIDLSEKYLVQFSKLIRLFFNFSRKRAICLKDELELLELYLSIEQMRFGEQLKFDFWIDRSLDLMNTYIPTMLLQPILENAVNHGIFHKKGIGHILVKLERINQKAYRIIIADDGVGWKNVQEVLKKSLANRRLSSTKVLLEKIDLLNQSKHWDISLQVTDNVEDKSGTAVQFDIRQIGKIIQSKHKNKLQKDFS